MEGRQIVDINNETQTNYLLESIEIEDRGTKEERFIVLDLKNVQSYDKFLVQVPN